MWIGDGRKYMRIIFIGGFGIRDVESSGTDNT
jgi:hypothetical protein